MRPFVGFLTLAVAVVLIAGCGQPDRKAESTSHAETAPPVSAATPSEEVSAKTSECKDEIGDGGSMDLVSASIRTSESVVVTAELAAPLPRNDTVSVGILALSRDYDTSLLIGKWVNGRAAEHYVSKVPPDSRDDLPLSGIRANGRRVTMTFPISAVNDLGKSWRWGAWTNALSEFTDATGGDVDACPGPPAGMGTQRFDSKDRKD